MNSDLEFDNLFLEIKKITNATEEDFKKLQEAYFLAQKAHAGQIRKSGEPFISHPIETAKVLLGMDTDIASIIAAFLHDTIEDSTVSYEEIEKSFGKKIANIVQGVTKLGKISFASKEEQQAENFRKMFLAMASDIRVILVKMADRLHNMRTLQYLEPKQRYEIAKETKEIYAPLAHRLGMGIIKWEFEDLAFRFLEPDEFKKIKALISEKREERKKYLDEFILNLKNILQEANIKADVFGRPKHFYSIYRKMKNQNLDFSDVYDLLGTRVIVEKISECYTVIGLIHNQYKPIPGKFKDYIAMPKNNMYRSLHTTVIGKFGRPIEIQIRTEEMHKINEYGVAAHWKYKEGKTSSKEQIYEEKLIWLRQLIEWQQDLSDAKDYMDSLKLNLFEDSVFVFTPKGDVHELRENSTPIDFAYHIHTEIGHRCIGAKANGHIVPLNYRLKNGDIIEVITSKSDSPKRDWLDFVVSSQARAKIKAWLKKNSNLEIAIPNISPLKHEKKKNILQTIFKKGSKKKNKNPFDIVIEGGDNLLFHMAKCCNPLPGDKILGQVTKGHGISIHKASCSNIIDQDKTIKAYWAEETTSLYTAELAIEAVDRVGIFSDIMNSVSANNINIKKANVYTHDGQGTITAKMILDIYRQKDLQKIINAIYKIKGVYLVQRK